MRSLRQAYGEVLVELGERDKDIVVLDADLSSSTHTKMFAERFPDRFFNVGVQESNLMGIAAGLASLGKKVFVSTFAVFASGRAWEIVRLSIAYSGFPVKIVATHGGCATGEDGYSHHGNEDIALMCAIPKMVVLSPSDYESTKAVIRAVYKYNGYVYVRLVRPKVVDIYREPFEYEIGKAIKLKEGKDVALLGTGILTGILLEASNILEKEGIEVSVWDFLTIKPLDEEALREIADSIKYGVITAEDHVLDGGFGSRVARFFASYKPLKMDFIGINDFFTESGSFEDLYKKYGFTAEKVVERVKKFLK